MTAVSRSKRSMSAWITGIAMTAALFAGLYLLGGFRYSGNDDSPILRSFMGFEGGEPASYSLILNSALSWALHFLAKAFPGVAWLSILQLFMLFLANVVIVKSAMQRAALSGVSPLWGAALGAVYLAVFSALVTSRVNHAATAALTGAACTAQTLSIDWENASRASRARSLSLSLFLLVMAYCLRQMAGLAAIAWFLLALLASFLCMAPKRRVTPFIAAAVCMALCAGGLYGFQAYENDRLELDGFLEWQAARTRVMDYTEFTEDIDPGLAEDVGWVDGELKLVTCWYFLDENITAQAFDHIYEGLSKGGGVSVSDRINGGAKLLRDFIRTELAMTDGIYIILALCAMGLIAGLSAGGRGARCACALLCAVAMCAILAYLSYMGRMPMRAAACAVFPAGAAIICLLPGCFRGGKRRVTGARAVPALLIAAACLFLAGRAALTNYNTLYTPPVPEEEQVNTVADLDHMALQYPDCLIIYDLSLASDDRMFPDVSQGIPANLMFWGGYPARTPSYMAQLKRFGIDGEHFTAKDWLRENVLYASTDGEPWVSLMKYISATVGDTIDYDFYDQYGYVNIFDIYDWAEE